jgi:hypothetical protein
MSDFQNENFKIGCHRSVALPGGLQGPFDFSNLTDGLTTDVSHPFPYRPANLDAGCYAQ